MTPDPEASLPLTGSQVDTKSDAGVKATASSQLPTLGERLVREAQRIGSSHVPAYPWLGLLGPAMKRVNSLPVPSEARFQRTEATRVAAPFRRVSYEPLAEVGIFWPEQPFPYPDVREQLVEEEAEEGWKQPLSHPTVREPLIERSSQAWGQSSPHPTVKESLSRGRSQAWGQPLSPYVQQRLREFVGPGTEAIRVHTDEMANAITRAQRADAVTVGEQVFFRQGHFRPHEDEGFALLTHEAMHVIQAMRPGSAWRRATQVGVQEEEQEASIQERDVLRARQEVTFLSQPTQRAAPASRYPALPERRATVERSTIRSERGSLMPEPTVPSSPVQRPMAAPAERTPGNAAPPTPPVPDVEDLKRTIYRDLMRQIQADLERGG